MSWLPVLGKERHEKRDDKAKGVCSAIFGWNYEEQS